MRSRQALVIALAALLAAGLGLAASVALYGPAPLLASPLGRLVEGWLPGPPGVAIAELGDRVPAWTLADLQGRPQPVFRPGQATLLNYWASWCLPCREELPMLAAFGHGPNPSVAVVAIALDEPADARHFLSAQGLDLPVLIEAAGPADSSVRLGNRRGVLPYSVLIGPDGRLLARKLGAFRSAAELRQWVEAGLAGGR